MRVDRNYLQVAARHQLGNGGLEVVVSKPEAIHAGIDLEMTPQSNAASFRRRLQRPARARARDCRCEVIREHAVDIADAQRAEHEDLGADPGAAQHNRLFDVGAGKNPGAGLLKRERHRRCTVPVGVGLDDGDDARRSGRVLLQECGDRPEVRRERGEIDMSEGAAR